ncbi:MAG: phasin family protein [Alphaproteobacteria bacterium]
MATTKKNGAAKATQETLESAAAAQKKTFEDAVQAGTEAFAKSYEQFYTTAREQMDKAQKSALENMDQLSDASRENAEVLVVSGNIFAKGFEIVGKEIAAYAERTIEANLAAAQQLGVVKNPQEFLDLQTQLAKAAYDDFVTESAKLQDLSVKVSNEAVQPLNERLNKVVENFSKSIAA